MNILAYILINLRTVCNIKNFQMNLPEKYIVNQGDNIIQGSSLSIMLVLSYICHFYNSNLNDVPLLLTFY